MPDLPKATKTIVERAAALGLVIKPQVLDDSTRTAQEAADSVGCNVDQIVKSLIFQGKTSGEAILLLVSGKNRVKESSVSQIIGEKITRPDAGFVREVTGFAIGGIPPLGHTTPIKTWMDQDLISFDTVHAACGTPNAIFAVSPEALVRVTNAEIISVTGKQGDDR